MNIDGLVNKVKELENARESVARLERELGEMVGDSVAGAAGKMPVAGAARVAQKDFPPEGLESLPKRLLRLLVENPERTFTPESAKETLGERFADYSPRTFTSLLYRAARKGAIAKKGPRTFGAKAKKTTAHKIVRRRSGS